jgi:hypothetical protein
VGERGEKREEREERVGERGERRESSAFSVRGDASSARTSGKKFAWTNKKYQVQVDDWKDQEDLEEEEKEWEEEEEEKEEEERVERTEKGNELGRRKDAFLKKKQT